MVNGALYNNNKKRGDIVNKTYKVQWKMNITFSDIYITLNLMI